MRSCGLGKSGFHRYKHLPKTISLSLLKESYAVALDSCYVFT